MEYSPAHLWLIEHLASDTASARDHRSYIVPDIERQKAIAKKLTSYGLTAFSSTLVSRAITDLGLKRLYDPNEGQAEAAAEDAIRRADSAPLNQALAQRLNQMSPAEVSAAYYSDADHGYFRRVYNRAAQLWGYRIPAEPSKQTLQGPAPVQTLTAKEYHSLPAATIVRKYRADQSFRQQVDGLIQRGEI